MAKDPAFLFYSSDFLSGVTDLTMEERGQYITLLCLQHQKGNLSEKTIRLTVGSVSVDVLSKFQIDESGNYFNERLLIEVEKRANFIESRINNGKLGGRPKASGLPNGKPSAKPNGKAKKKLPVNVNEDENISINISEEEFLNYGKSLLNEKYDSYEFALKQKYAAWVADGWVDGHGNKIKNWKTKLGNTISFLKPMNNNIQNDKFTKQQSKLKGLEELGNAAREFLNRSGNTEG